MEINATYSYESVYFATTDLAHEKNYFRIYRTVSLSCPLLCGGSMRKIMVRSIDFCDTKKVTCRECRRKCKLM